MPARKRNSYRYKTKYRRSKNLKRVKKTFKLVLVSLTGLFLFAVAFYLYSISLVVKKPFANASSGLDLNDHSYDSVISFNVLFIQLDDLSDDYSNIQNLYLLNINPTKSKLLLLKIPTDTEIELSSTQGYGEVSKLYSMGNFADEKRGAENVTEFIQRKLAIGVDAYVIYDKNTVNSFSDLGISVKQDELPSSLKFAYYLKIPGIFDSTRKNLKSDLSTIEALKLFGDIKSISPVDYSYYKLDSDDIKNPAKFDDKWQELTLASYLNTEREKVIVLNSTETSGVATWGARVVKNRGGVVIDATNQDEHYNETVIYTDMPEDGFLKYIATVVGAKKVLPTSDYTIDDFVVKRADYLIVIGENTSIRF